MSKTDELLDKAILIALLQDQFSDNYYDKALILLQKLTRRVSRILSPEYGRNLSLREKRAIKNEITEEVQQYSEQLRLLAEEQLAEAAEVFYEQEKKIIEDTLAGTETKDPPDLRRGLFSTYHPIDKGKVVQLDLMYRTHTELVLQSFLGVLDRLSTVVEDRPVARGYFTSAANQNQNILNAIAITSIMLVASFARQSYYRRNKSLFDGYQWISVLDERTTDYCQHRHLQVWFYNQPERSTLAMEEHPPGHFRCRSITVPIFRGEDPVESPTFEEWFENQPSDVQREVLGPHRYDMYSSGAISISDINDARGRRRTLRELKNL
jgi:hypothetical protein